MQLLVILVNLCHILYSFLIKHLLAYAIGYHELFYFCSKHVPIPYLLASHFTPVSLFTLKFLFSTVVFIVFFKYFCVLLAILVLFLKVVLLVASSGRRGA